MVRVMTAISEFKERNITQPKTLELDIDEIFNHKDKIMALVVDELLIRDK